MNYKESMEYIENTVSLGIVPGLDAMRELLKRIGKPQEQLRFIHIAGTNGKGSVLAYISTVLKTAGYKTGRYLSPVILDYWEKIQVNEKYISKKSVAEGMTLIRVACESMKEEGLSHPTVFEMETALAFWYFARKKCDIVVLEAGMGGLMDATNVIGESLVSVFTSIGMDHMQFLGDTIEKIAEQKAGIMKQGGSAVAMKGIPAAMEVLQKKAAQMQVALQISDVGFAKKVKYGLQKQKFSYKGVEYEISLSGNFQIANAILAIDVIEVLNNKGYSISSQNVQKGLAETVWQGRFEVLCKKPLFITDGAHNEDAAVKLSKSLEYYFTNRRIIYIMGMLRDKEIDRVIELTEKYADQIITVTPPANSRAMSALELAEHVSEKHKNVTATDSLEEAVEMAMLLAGKEDVIVAFGSLSFQGKLIAIMTNIQNKVRK